MSTNAIPAKAHVAAARRDKAVNGYLLSWAALAAGALGYLGVAATRPDLLSVILPLTDHSYEQAGARQGGDVTEEIAALRKWVHDLQHEMAAAKSAIQESAQRNQDLVQRLAAAEERIPGQREVRAEQPSTTPRAAVKIASRVPPRTEPDTGTSPATTAASATEPVIAKETVTTAALETAAAAGVRVLNPATAPSSSASSIVTGSVALPAATGTPPAPTSFSAPKVTTAAPAVTPRGIEIAHADSLDGLRAQWGSIADTNGEILKSLSPRYRISAGGAQNPFTLLAGPFASTADALKACASLRARGIGCKVGEFGGNSL